MIQRTNQGKAGWAILAAIVGGLIFLALIVLLVIRGGYNKAVALDVGVKDGWAEVENQLTRRFDLVPNLVNTVKGYAEHEKELFEHIADARTQYFQAQQPAEKMQAANLMQGFLSRLLVLQERYPDLKANENFLKLQDQLEGTENRLAVARKRYNDAVKLLNTYARSFFGRFYCSMADVKSAEFFDAPEEKTVAPRVEF